MFELLTTVIGAIGTELVAAAVAAGVTLVATKYFRAGRRRRIRRRFADLLGIDRGPLMVVHSAVLDPSRAAYNYPASDSRSARILATALDSVGLKEGLDYFIFAAPEVEDASARAAVWTNNVLLLCGPKRNPLVAEALGWSGETHYRMGVSAGTGENFIIDRLRGAELMSFSRSSDGQVPHDTPDYAYLLSFPSPRATGKRITIVAGIHGVGTLGGIQFLVGKTDGRLNTEILVSRGRHGTVSEVLRVDFTQNESVTSTILV